MFLKEVPFKSNGKSARSATMTERLQCKLLRLRDKGMPTLNGGCGDLHVRVDIEIPQGLNAKQREALEDFAAACTSDNFPEARKLLKQTECFFKRRDTLKKIVR